MREYNLVYLNSVGTCIDKTTLITYPVLSNGKADPTSIGVHVEDCDYEWFGALSSEDLLKLAEVRA